ncbi:MAG: hypothetical protein ACYC1L_06160 [Alphaproteobacteria bacterium]
MKRFTALAVSAALALPGAALAQTTTPAPGTVVPQTAPMNTNIPPPGAKPSGTVPATPAQPGGGQKMGADQGKKMGQQGDKEMKQKKDKKKVKKHMPSDAGGNLKPNPPPKTTP